MDYLSSNKIDIPEKYSEESISESADSPELRPTHKPKVSSCGEMENISPAIVDENSIENPQESDECQNNNRLYSFKQVIHRNSIENGNEHSENFIIPRRILCKEDILKKAKGRKKKHNRKRVMSFGCFPDNQSIVEEMCNIC